MRRAAILVAALVYPAALFAAQGPSVSSGALRTAAALVLVVALMFGLAAFLKRFGPVARAGRNLGLSVLGQVALGPKTYLAMVRLEKSVLLLGVTPSSISLIKEMETERFDDVLVEARDPQGGQGAPS